MTSQAGLQTIVIDILPNIERSENKQVMKFGQLTLSALRAAGSGTEDCRGRSPLGCNHVGRACKKPPCLKEN